MVSLRCDPPQAREYVPLFFPVNPVSHLWSFESHQFVRRLRMLCLLCVVVDAGNAAPAFRLQY